MTNSVEPVVKIYEQNVAYGDPLKGSVFGSIGQVIGDYIFEEDNDGPGQMHGALSPYLNPSGSISSIIMDMARHRLFMSSGRGRIPRRDPSKLALTSPMPDKKIYGYKPAYTTSHYSFFLDNFPSWNNGKESSILGAKTKRISKGDLIKAVDILELREFCERFLFHYHTYEAPVAVAYTVSSNGRRNFNLGYYGNLEDATSFSDFFGTKVSVQQLRNLFYHSESASSLLPWSNSFWIDYFEPDEERGTSYTIKDENNNRASIPVEASDINELRQFMEYAISHTHDYFVLIPETASLPRTSGC